MNKMKTRPFDMVNYLSSEEDIQEYLSQVLEDGEPAELAAALGDIKPLGDGVFEMREFFDPAGACTTWNAQVHWSSGWAAERNRAKPRTSNVPKNWQRNGHEQDEDPAVRHGQLLEQ